MPDKNAVQAVLADFLDPELGRSVVALEQVHALDCGANRIAVTLGLTSYSAAIWPEVRAELTSLLQSRFPGTQVAVDLAIHQRPAEKSGTAGLSVKSVLLVGSGKGGVGKSTVAASLACGLRRLGSKVGLLDADLYGPSIPHLFGSQDRPQIVNDRVQPVMIDGMPVMSIGFLIPADEAVIWRGPMLHGAITQFFRDTEWGDLDFLVVDLPPGTGDIAISVSQLVPVAGAVVVCTPQDVALLDALKAITMFRKVQIDLLGLIENMSFFICPNCRVRHEIFGFGGVRRHAAELNVPFLGELPIQPHLRELGDAGEIQNAWNDPALHPYFEQICKQLVGSLTSRRRQRPPMPTLPIL